MYFAALVECNSNNIIVCFCCRERAAVKQLMEVAKDTRPGGPAQGAHIHVVHLSDAEDSLSLIKVSVNPYI